MVRILWLGLIATLAIAACINLTIDKTPASDFEYVCQEVEQEYGADCKSLEPPIVVISELVTIVSDGFRGNIWGIYIHDEPYVFINPLTPNIKQTIIHEIGHYVVHSLVPEITRCESEEFVRKIAGQDWGPEQKKFYGCKGEESDDYSL